MTNLTQLHTRLWYISSAVSLVLILVLISVWMLMNKHEIPKSPLIDEKAINDYITKNWDSKHATPATKIKTGIFIQSLKFFDSTEVNLSGYIWQHYVDGVNDEYIPAKNEVGFILPEHINSGSGRNIREAYRRRIGKNLVIGWYFEATLRQPFEYSLYPFDHKTVWIRFWAKDFNKNVILVPDFAAYNSKNKKIIGIEDDIVLGTWDRKETYFNYKLTDYDTNFGLTNYIGQSGFPELHYNFVVKRKFENAFTIYLLPLLLVAALLFAALLTVSDMDGLSSRLGFSTSGFIGASSALFFVVMLAHIQLREQFASTGIVYLEYFYILMYLLLVLTTANTFMFSIRSTFCGSFILYHDNLIPKLIYWPIIISSMIIISLIHLY